jgi:CRP-like cAMP-binding protein
MDRDMTHPAKAELRRLLAHQAAVLGLTTQAIDELVRCARIEEPRRSICCSGDHDGLVNLVVAGAVRVEIILPNRRRMFLKFVGRGEIFCLTPSPQSGAYVLRATPHDSAVMAAWTRENLSRVLALLPIASVVQLLTTSWLHLSRFAEGRCLLRMLPVAERVTLFIGRLARRHGRKHPLGTLIDLPLRARDIALLVGASRWAVGRHIAILRRAKRIAYVGDRLLLLDAPDTDATASSAGNGGSRRAD